MKTSIENPIAAHNGKMMAGILILAAGAILLLNQFNLFFIPNWLFSWPMWVIGYGVYMGGKYNFRKPIWIWMIVLGFAFLLTENFDNADKFVWPIAIIGYGLYTVTKHNRAANADYTGNHFNKV
jgi:hypothetical protein